MGFLWPLAVTIIGVAFAIQWGKTRTAKLANQKLQLEIKHSDSVRQTSLAEDTLRDNELARNERQLALSLKDTPEGRELEASRQVRKAAENRAAAIEADTKAKAVAQTLPEQVAAEREIIAARLKASLDSIKGWVDSHPDITLPNPFEGLNFEAMYKNCVYRQEQAGEKISTFDEFVGDSAQRIMISFAQVLKS